jgi:preprotein translocase subunit YajC
MGPLLVLILLFFVMYTVMIRPQQRRAREHQALIAAVEVGDDVMTTAGIFGRVSAVEGDVISIEISPGVVMRVARAAIGRRIVDEPEPPDNIIEDTGDDGSHEPPHGNGDVPGPADPS